VLLLLGGIAGTTIGFVRAEQALAAEEKRAEGELLAKQSAQKRLAQVEKGIDLLGSIFDNLDPRAEEKEGRPLRLILGDRLDQAAADLEGEAVGDPLVVARLQDRLARTYLGLGQAAKAQTLVARALATRRAQLGPDDPLTLQTLSLLAEAYHVAGKPYEAIKLYEEVREAQTRLWGPNDPQTLATLNDLGRVYWIVDQAGKAITLLEQVWEARKQLYGPNDEATIATMSNLATAYVSARKGPEAIAVAQKVLDARRQKYSDDHPLVLAAMNSLARAYSAGFKMRQALELYEQARDAVVPRLGPTHPQTLVIQHNLVHMYRAFGRLNDAIALGEEVRERRLILAGPFAPATLDTIYELAMAYRADKQLDKALPLFEQMASGLYKNDFAQINAGLMMEALCECREGLGQFDPAETWRRRWLAAVKAKDGPESFTYAQGLRNLGWNLLQQKKWTEAELQLRDCLTLLRKDPAKITTAFEVQALVGTALVGQEKYTDAEPLLLRAYQGLKDLDTDQAPTTHGAPGRQRLAEARSRLVHLYESWGKTAEADKWRNDT
jgi:tetratricopeptide (TPR) repeat protein